MLTIGFVGLGHMGFPMARNLLKANFNVMAYDILSSAMDSIIKEGASVVSSLAEMAKQCDVVITMLQTSEQVSDICLREDGIFLNANKNILYIDSSSIDIDMTRSLHKKAEEYGIAMIDAPVSGGTKGAESAMLTFMVGGKESDFLRAKEILNEMGKKIIYAGLGGNGQAAKICNNLILGISMIAVCEGFSLAQKLGLDPKKFFEISSNASGQCWSMTNYCPVPDVIDNSPANHHYHPGFMAKMMLKDLYLGQHAAESVNTAIPLGEKAAELYAAYVSEGYGEMDFSGIINMISGGFQRKGL